MNEIVQKPYVHQAFPKRVYRGSIDDNKVVNDPDELEEAIAEGYAETYATDEDAEEAPAPVAKPKAKNPAKAKVKMPPAAAPAESEETETEPAAE